MRMGVCHARGSVLAGVARGPYLAAVTHPNPDGAPMRTLTRPRVSSPTRALFVFLGAAAPAVLFAAGPNPAAAQSMALGGVAGLTRSRQLLERAPDSQRRDGFTVGAWVDVPTPAPLLHVLAEASYARRGGRFPLAGPSGVTGEVESDWITSTVAPTLRVGVGPVAAYVYGGPTLELHARTRSAAALRNAYATPSDQAFSATAGAGLEGLVSSWSFRGEVRVVEGLSAAYSGSGGDIRHRSLEVVLRVGMERGRK